MKKILKENKGFSLVELLIALLIMAVIAGTAITLFGGVLETSKGGADRETAESIKRAILTYMNATNDTDLNALGVATTDASTGLIAALASTLTISGTTATLVDQAGAETTTADATLAQGEVEGKFGPFLEKEIIKPLENGKAGWGIAINSVTQVIKVTAVDGEDAAIVTITTTP